MQNRAANIKGKGIMNEIHRVENITTKTNELTTNSNQFFFFSFLCVIFSTPHDQTHGDAMILSIHLNSSP